MEFKRGGDGGGREKEQGWISFIEGGAAQSLEKGGGDGLRPCLMEGGVKAAFASEMGENRFMQPCYPTVRVPAETS